VQLFVDKDGVLADFAGHFEAVFGWRPDQEDDVDWTVVRQVEDFHLNIPPMADLQLLWDRIERYQPIVLRLAFQRRSPRRPPTSAPG
jgi:hypothetical protein